MVQITVYPTQHIISQVSIFIFFLIMEIRVVSNGLSYKIGHDRPIELRSLEVISFQFYFNFEK